MGKMKDQHTKLYPPKEKSPMQDFTFLNFSMQFPDQESCMWFILNKQHPNGVTCKKCGEVRKHSYFEKRKRFACNHCGTHVCPTAGTIFHKSRTPLVIWFYTVFLIANTRTGVSAKKVERDTGVTYKTAWRMCTLIRTQLDEGKSPYEAKSSEVDSEPTVLGGDDKVVEVDETFYGAKSKEGKRGRGSENKKPVIGIMERGGRVHAKLVPDTKKVTLQGEIKTHVEQGTEVHTDEHLGYHALQNAGYVHMSVNHSKKQYATIDGIHTNSIEGFWGNFKMGVLGNHHHISHKYLNGYLAEHSFRYNHRNDTQAMFWSMMNRMMGQSAHLAQGKLNVL